MARPNLQKLITTAATTDGVTTEGAESLGFFISAGGSAMINGNIPLTPSGIRSYTPPILPQGQSYESIPYTVASGTLYISEVV